MSTLDNSYFKELQRHLSWSYTVTYLLPFSFFTFTFMPLCPQHVPENIEKENKNLRLINIPAYHLAGIPAVWWSLSYPADSRKTRITCEDFTCCHIPARWWFVKHGQIALAPLSRQSHRNTVAIVFHLKATSIK